LFFFFSIATKRKKNDAPVMFWTALVTSSAELRQRSAAECNWRSALLTAWWGSTLPFGEEPEILDV
jgi:hypothetical protein